MEIAAGEPVPAEKDENLAYVEIPRIFLKDDATKYCVFRINGHSMEPEINHNDIVVIRYKHEWESMNGKICAIRTDDGITLKKVQMAPEKNQVMLLPFNHAYNVILIDEESNEQAFLVGVMALQFRVCE
ncbi:MAG: S24 family peptidase [Candidatus Cloacimonetes bacterium]|nr:S24 family peptidase [Candidatus Cloacimonadota bacterium]